jgi:putative CocE/NonD family hydrolase
MRFARSSCFSSVLLLSLGLLAGCKTIRAQDVGKPQTFAIQEIYAKSEVYITMRDGQRLFTIIYAPKDTTQKHPIIMTRTPYSVAPYGEGKLPTPRGTDLKFMQAGYIVVKQDVRGRFLSEGKFEDVRPEDAAEHGKGAVDESTDTYDTIDWLVKNVPNNNGRVGIWGISYPGFYAATGGINSHPALKAISPEAPVCDWFIGDDDHHNGALFLMDCVGFLTFFGPDREQPTTESKPFLTFSPTDTFRTDAYKFYLDLGPLKNVNAKYFHDKIAYWNNVTQHPNYDAFWKARALPSHLKGVNCAALTVGGWYDAEDLYGPFAVSSAIERLNPGTSSSLVMGPWPHGGWGGGDFDRFGDETFGQKTGAFYRDNILMPFFNHYLLEDPNGKPPRATVFNTGANRWLTFAHWPPSNTKPLSLTLSGNHQIMMSASTDTAGGEYDEWASDPANPVPYIGETRGGRKNEYMNDDQRFTATRPDVMMYQTPPLDQDMTIAGPIKADLMVSTTGTDADFITKVIDVYPDDTPDPQPNPGNVKMGGYQKLVRAEVMRARFRDSYSDPKAMPSGKPTRVAYELRDVCHTFKKGHRIMVQVQSSWFPLVDRNPQTFVDIYKANESDFQKATHRLYHSTRLPSRVILPLLQSVPQPLPVADTYLTSQ